MQGCKFFVKPDSAILLSLRVFEYVCMQWLVYYSAYLNKGVMNSYIFTSQADM